MMKACLLLSLLMSLAIQAARADTTLKSVSSLDDALVSAVRNQALAAGLHDATLIKTQSFVVLQNGKPIGMLMSGTGSLSIGNGISNGACFVAWQNAGEPAVSILPTVGSGDWEAETCRSVSAVGLLDTSSSAFSIGFAYSADSPHATVEEPVVLSMDPIGHTLHVNAVETKRASDTGATTIKAMRRISTIPH